MFKRPTLAVALAASCWLVAPSHETAAQTVRVAVESIDLQTQKSPAFTFRLATDKRASERDWLEVEVALKVQQVAIPNQAVPMVHELQLRYFVLFAGVNPLTNQRYMATGVIDHVNVTVGDTVRSVAYIPPDAMIRFTGKTNYSHRDVEAVAIEVMHSGQLVGGDATAQKQATWWRGTFPGTPGFVQAKRDTPFAPLWYDYHLDVKLPE